MDATNAPRYRHAADRARAARIAACLLPLVIAAAATDAAAPAPIAPAWVALWQSTWHGLPPEQRFDPEHVTAVAAVDRTTGDAYLSMWRDGVWKSTDGGLSFTRVDGGAIASPGCGPITGAAAFVAGEGRGVATFNMNNSPGRSGYSADGGATWVAFTEVGRNWDFGAIDFATRLVIGARHEDDGLHVSRDGGQTWTRLAKPRAGVTGVAACGDALLVSGAGATERSADGGETWSRVADDQCTGQAIAFGGRIWWLAQNRNALVVSADAGRTWTAYGEPVPAPAKQAVFGEDERHVVALTDAGIYESTDAARTWRLVTTLPPDLAFWNVAFDAVHDVFYATAGLDRQVFMYARSRPPAYVAPAIASLDPARDEPDRPALRFVDDAHVRVRVLATRTTALVGDFLYQCGEDGLLYFRRDLRTGRLQPVEQILEERSGGFMMRCVGARMYGVTAHDGYRRAKWHGLAWFDLDPASGRPTRKGVVACPGADQLVVGPGGTDLYVKTRGAAGATVLRFTLDPAAAPTKAGEAAGAGIGTPNAGCDVGVLKLSPDGRFLYSISADDYAIARIERHEDGSIAYRGATDLAAVAPRASTDDPYRWVSLDLSADGRWLYAAIRNGCPSANRLAIFSRDARSGELALSEVFTGEQHALANPKHWNLAFSPSGRGGYVGEYGPLLSFRYDAATGHLGDLRRAPETIGKNTATLTYDTERGFLYVASQEWYCERFCVFAADAATASDAR